MSWSFLGFFNAVVDSIADIEGLEPLRFVVFVVGAVSVSSSSSSSMMMVVRCVLVLLVWLGGREVDVGVKDDPLLEPVLVCETVGGVFGRYVGDNED